MRRGTVRFGVSVFDRCVAGANPDIPGENNLTALQWARRQGKHDVTALLEAAGAAPHRPLTSRAASDMGIQRAGGLQ